MTDFPVRLAIVATHPIQHFVPLYRALAADCGIELCVFYASRMGLEPYFDTEMNQTFAWKMDLVSGYNHRFLCDIVPPPAAHSDVASPRAIAMAFTEFAPDAVVVYGYGTRVARDAARLARKTGLRLLMISDSELRAIRSWPRRLLKALVLPRLYRRFDAFLTVGDANEAYYRHYGVVQDKLFRSPFPIDEPAFCAARDQRAEHRVALRSRLGLPTDAFLALFVGKLSPRKRPGDLLAATALARECGRNVSAVLAGDGTLRTDLEAQATRLGAGVHLLGFINVDELPSLYAGSDVVVHPSQSDPHPLICSEAACVGLPMVLSDRVGAEGPTDIAQNGKNVIVYPVGNQEALAKALGRLASDPELVIRMGAESRRIFQSLDMRRSVAGIHHALAATGLPVGGTSSPSAANAV